jgi:hypothetical protein
MGYYAGTVYTRINVKKDKFSIIKERAEIKFSKWNLNFTDANSILTGLGYEPDYDSDGNLETLNRPEATFHEEDQRLVLDLLEGLVDEGDHFEWLGSEGDDNRWIDIHRNGKWETHDGQVEVTYPSLKNSE